MLKKIIIIGVGCLVAVCVMFVGIYLVFASTFKDPLAANGPQVAENVSLKNDGISYKDEDGTLHIDRSFKLSLK
ncbi:hypothetical protein CathTA2_0999 [Caldalkalibacillus thermarum TA2.A1]|uniref:Uncharacterized protein n=1 Tax=Caldalkalibacillus thermarum (strain TA2.A1) TaxID=986075 RepID=F5L5D6_CALTT|nr:hypothetical protein [Caldalkalibacillus thermarum]EGL83435.1 hypothetical protein CathTA2_0999 [Caldalkalibacillus thermarum TA2.A1]QZT34677.1 hypothetical protein HUR95_04885 [Caldalkalibacillus thermarum TA2.A1]